MHKKRLKGYKADEIIGEHFSRFYPKEDVDAAKPARELEIATATGQYEEEGWRVRKDGSRFWASGFSSARKGGGGELLGFVKIFRDLHTMTRKVIAAQLDRLPQHRIDVHQFALHRPLPRKAQEILHDVLRPLRLLQNNLPIFAGVH